jgi:hypothetical protein
MSERWFSSQELTDMSRPTMDRAIEALDAGDVAKARELCDAMRKEWRVLHDVMTELIAGLITFVGERLEDDGVEAAWRSTMEKTWRTDAEKVGKADRKRLVEGIAATWRAHSTSGTGPHPGAFKVEEDDVKFTFTMYPCGTGQRLWLRGRYEGEHALGVTREAHDWSYGRAGFPLYCTHCTFMNELLPIEWLGMPLYPSDAPEDFDHDPCVWYWYKDPAAIPDRHWERYGARKPKTLSSS